MLPPSSVLRDPKYSCVGPLRRLDERLSTGELNVVHVHSVLSIFAMPSSLLSNLPTLDITSEMQEHATGNSYRNVATLPSFFPLGGFRICVLVVQKLSVLENEERRRVRAPLESCITLLLIFVHTL